MRDNITRILIETTVRRMLREMKDSPERNARNLVDMALHFSEGRFQQHFFQIAQEILCNENSSYYELIRDAVSTIDTDRLVTFGINLGYNSCTLGAKTIRNTESDQHFYIPWSLTLMIDTEQYPLRRESYFSVVSQGKAMGIYTYLIFSTGKPLTLLSLVKEHPDCAFLLFCPADGITKGLLKQARELPNLMFAIRYEEGANAVCGALREDHFMFAVYMPYKKEDAEDIINGRLLCKIGKIHPAFTFFVSDISCPKEIQHSVYRYINDTRQRQAYATIPMDIIFDNQQIDRIISDESYNVGFDEKGYLYTLRGKEMGKEYNLFANDLANILKLAFPMHTQNENAEQSEALSLC